MSRILELQPTDEQTIVARVLLELHQAIDAHFPNVNASARQFTKTVLSHQSDQPAAEKQANASSTAFNPNQVSKTQPKSSLSHSQSSNLEFSKPGMQMESMRATAMEEAPWSRWLTKLLVVSLIAGAILFAWIYLFGI